MGRVARGRRDRRELCNRFDFTMLSTTLDSLVAVFVQVGKVLPQVPVGLGDCVVVRQGSKLVGESRDSVDMELVLVRLEIPKLGEGLVAIV